MAPEILSTARPDRLRLLGFLALVVGAATAGVGASMTWATIGFPADTAGAADVLVKGVDVWEGVVVLALAAAVLIAMIAMRVVPSSAWRRAIAVAILVAGVAVTGLAAADLARREARFGGGEGLRDIARSLASESGLSVDRVRARLEANFGRQLRVDVGPGLYAGIAGGVAIAVAGGLALGWARRPP